MGPAGLGAAVVAAGDEVGVLAGVDAREDNVRALGVAAAILVLWVLPLVAATPITMKKITRAPAPMRVHMIQRFDLFGGGTCLGAGVAGSW